jgi:hypothetical protein
LKALVKQYCEKELVHPVNIFLPKVIFKCFSCVEHPYPTFLSLRLFTLTLLASIPCGSYLFKPSNSFYPSHSRISMTQEAWEGTPSPREECRFREDGESELDLMIMADTDESSEGRGSISHHKMM